MSQKMLTGLSITVAVGLVWFAIASGKREAKPVISQTEVPVVRMENGVQVIRVFARGGYQPNVIRAQSGVPTKLEVETKGTYDCSASFTIPALEYKKMLPPTGLTVIDIPVEATTKSLTGLCGMGMYSFELQFNESTI